MPAQNPDPVAARTSPAEARLRELIEAQFDFVWRSLRRLGLSGTDAEEGTREVLLVASRGLKGITSGHERRFLFATAVREVSSRRYGARRRGDEPGATGQKQAVPSGAKRLIELSHAREDLQLILDGLELRQRAVFILFELEELSTAEISSTLGVPVGAVSARIRTAQEYFREFVRRLRERDALKKEPLVSEPSTVEQTRLREQGTPAERRLLASAGTDRPDPVARRATLLRVLHEHRAGRQRYLSQLIGICVLGVSVAIGLAIANHDRLYAAGHKQLSGSGRGASWPSLGSASAAPSPSSAPRLVAPR